MRLRVRTVLCCSAVLFFTAQTALPQQTLPGRETSAASVQSYPLSQQMPVDPEVTLGTLSNGVRYYVRANARPSRRAELRLVVKAGSVLEDEDQRGLAHFVEHMEFEGTQHFPGQGIVQFLGTLGLGLGADANAATSYDDTQYTLRVPTDAPGALDRAMLVLEDWAHGATFDDAGIERERGIVLSEWREQLGAGERTMDKVHKVQLEGSRYADRPPIGSPDTIRQARREQLMRFYRDWYRPDLMAVIAVGDFDRAAVETMIKQHFSSLTGPSPERPRPEYDVPEHAGTRFAIVTDKETTNTAVELSDLRPARNQGSVGGYRDIMLDQLFAAMLGARLDELTQTADAPFLRAAADRGLFPMPRTKDEAILQALVSPDGISHGLEALVTELQRVVRFGFTATELTRAKQAMMVGYERVVTESPDRESASRADEYTRNFLEGEALPTIWQELAFHRRFMPDVTLSEINALAADWFPERNRLVIVSAPQTTGAVLPTDTQLAAVVKEASTKKLQAYVDTAAGESLMSAAPKSGSIVKSVDRPGGVIEWTLSNGATVVLKPTKLKEDQILFRATAPGGFSLADDANFIPARVADDVIYAGGAGQYSAVMLDKLMTGKAVVVRPFITDLDEGMAGGSTPQDVESMFQLLYLRFTEPRADPNAFAAMAAQAKGLLANQLASPDVVFNQAVDAALSRNSPRRQPETPATVDQWDLAKSLAFYKARFADAGNFTFVFVGSFTPAMLKPLVETYIASLPATHTHETWRDVNIAPPDGVVEKTVEKGIAPKSEVAIVFSGPFQYDDAHRLALRAMTMVLQSRLFDSIRQELGGTYSIEATPDTDKFPRPTFKVRIEWASDPERMPSLVQRVFDELDFVKNTRLTRNQMALVRQALLRDFETNSQDNRYLLNQISRKYEDGDAAGVGAVFDLPARVQALTADEIQSAAQTALDTNRYVKVMLNPEKQ